MKKDDFPQPRAISPTEVNLAVLPNPVRAGTAVVNYGLVKHGKVTLNLIDANGRFVQSIGIRHQNAGTYSYRLDNLSKLANGYYILVLEQNSEVIGRRQFIIRK